MRKKRRFRVLLFILLIFGVAATQVLAKNASGHYLDAERFTLANGLTVIIKSRPANGQVMVRMCVRAGAYYEEDQYAGIANFTAHMAVNRGTENLAPGDLPRMVDLIGGKQNGGTTHDQTYYYIQGSSSDLSRILDLMAEICFRPTFAQDQIDEERRVIEEEILRSANDPSRQLYLRGLAHVFKGTNYARPALGTMESIRNCDSQAFRDFFSRYYRPNNMVLVLVGDVYSEQALPLIDSIFGGFAPGEIPAAVEPQFTVPSEPVVIKEESTILKPGNAQAMLMFYVPLLSARESAALSLLTAAYCGGSHSILKEAYAGSTVINSIDCYYYIYDRMILFILEVTGPADKIDSFEGNLRTSVNRFFNQIEKTRLEFAKQWVRAGYAWDAETLSGLAEKLSSAELRGDITYHQKVLQAIENLRAAEIKKVAKKYLNPNSYTLLIQYNPGK